MNKTLPSALLSLVLFVTAAAFGHTTKTVGEGDEQYDVIVGYATEPAFTEERNGLDLFVRTRDGEPVENLQNSLTVELIAPAGETLPLDLRAVHGAAGEYTDDFALSEPGVYRVHVTGFIGATEVDLTFEMYEVAPFDELVFP